MLISKVRKTIEKYGMLTRGDRVVVGLSGGPDSVALIYLLHSLREKYGLALHIAHLDHRIRGQESRDDAIFVKGLAERLDLPIIEREIDVPALVKRERLSLEEGARKARYQFFSDAAHDLRARRIAVGHTADDQAETVLMRIVRGSGMEGLGGIAPVSEVDMGSTSVVIIRPLIEVWRSDIERYLKEEGLDFREDSSNQDQSFLRNKVRLGLIPYLGKEYNPRIKEVLVRMGEILRDDYDYLSKEVEKVFLDIANIRDREVSLEAMRLRRFPQAIQRGVLRKAIEVVRGDLKRITYQNWRDLDSLIKSSNGNLSIDLAEGVKVKRAYDKLIFLRSESGLRPVKFSYRLSIPGLTVIPEAGLKIEAEVFSVPHASRLTPHALTQKSQEERRKMRDARIELFDYDRLRFPIMVRSRMPGDRISPLGMRGTKKVKDLFIDEKVPLAERATIPLVTTGDEEIIWVLGLRISDKYKVTARTKRILKLSINC